MCRYRHPRCHTACRRQIHKSSLSASKFQALLALLVLLVLPGRLPLYNSPPPPHQTSGGSISIADELGMIEVPCQRTNYEEEEREKGWEGAGCGYVSCKHTRKKDKCKFTHLRIGTYCSTYNRTRKTNEQDGTESESPKKTAQAAY